MGTHISFVRSTTFDGWSADNLKRMLAGGNAKAIEYFSKYGMRVSKCKSYIEFYDGKVARRYKDILDREAENVVVDVATPSVTPISSYYACGLDVMMGDIHTSQTEPVKTVETKHSPISRRKETNEMALLFNNMVVSSSKVKKRSPASKKKSPESKVVKPKRHARVVSIAQDDSSSNDDFEAEMEEAKSKKKLLFPAEPLKNENVEFVKGFGPSKSGLEKKEAFKNKEVGTSEVKTVFENKYGKQWGDKCMTSISSSDFIKDESTQHMQREHYKDATSIGSDAFFGREVACTGEDEIDWAHVRNEAVNKAQQLSEAASTWFSSVKDNLR